MGIRGILELYRDYTKMLLMLFAATCSASVQIHIHALLVAVFKSVFPLMPIIEIHAATSVVTRSLTCFYVYIPPADIRQAFGLLCSTSHPNMTGCHSNKTLLHTASGSYIMDGSSTQHLSLSASLLSHLWCFLTCSELDIFCVLQPSTMSQREQQR